MDKNPFQPDAPDNFLIEPQKPRAGEHTSEQSMKEEAMDENPYLLHGDELARTEAARIAGQSQGSALNPKAAWPFPQTRAELQAERDVLTAQNRELVEALHDLVPVAQETCKQWSNDDCFLIPTEKARKLLAKHGR